MTVRAIRPCPDWGSLKEIRANYIGGINSLPLSIYRIRKIVADIKSTVGAELNLLSKEYLAYLMPLNVTADDNAYWDNKLTLKKLLTLRNHPYSAE